MTMRLYCLLYVGFTLYILFIVTLAMLVSWRGERIIFWKQALRMIQLNFDTVVSEEGIKM